MFNYAASFGLGGALFAPQFGDYMQAVALGGTIWILFNANYAAEHGTFQLDPWLVLTPESSPLTVAATFNPPLADPGLPVTFTAKTTNAAGATAFAWTFGDSATGTGVSPTHAYSGTGKYTVQVTATDYLGRMATDIVKITVSTVLNATASAKPAVTDAGQNVSFAAIAAGGAGGYTYKWAFGDGGTSAVSSPIHVYAAAGAYSVNAWVNDSAGGSIARGFTVMVNAIPSVALSVSPSATDVGMALHFTSTVSGGTVPFRYAWDFKDASSSTAVAPAHSYGQAGSYSVELVVTDAVKIAAVSAISVTLNGRPVAAAKASNSAPAVGSAVGFTGSVTDGTGPFTYAWAFDDGASSSTQNSSHAFSGPGTYSVRLWVNDSVGGSSLAAITVVVSASGLSTTTAVIFSTVAFLVGVIATAIVLIAIARRRKKEEPAVAPPPPAEEKEDTIPPP
jgi:PKD repeat protein